MYLAIKGVRGEESHNERSQAHVELAEFRVTVKPPVRGPNPVNFPPTFLQNSLSPYVASASRPIAVIGLAVAFDAQNESCKRWMLNCDIDPKSAVANLRLRPIVELFLNRFADFDFEKRLFVYT